MTAFMEEYEGDFNEYYEGDEGDWGGYEEGAEEVIDDAHFDSQLAFAVPKKSKKAGKQSGISDYVHLCRRRCPSHNDHHSSWKPAPAL